jgi:hypothetical protein
MCGHRLSLSAVITSTSNELTVSSICFLVFLFIRFVCYSVHIDNSENCVRIGQQKCEDFYGAQEKGGKRLKTGLTRQVCRTRRGASCQYQHHDRNAAFTRQNHRTREDPGLFPPILPRKRSVPVIGNFLQFGGTDEMRPRRRRPQRALWHTETALVLNLGRYEAGLTCGTRSH